MFFRYGPAAGCFLLASLSLAILIVIHAMINMAKKQNDEEEKQRKLWEKLYPIEEGAAQ
jgi:hypothetical protein